MRNRIVRQSLERTPGQPQPITTDEQGRFRLVGAGGERLLRIVLESTGIFHLKGPVPGQPYQPGGPPGTGPSPRFGLIRVAPSEKKDLGVARVQP